MRVTLPHNYTPRPYQVPLYNARAEGFKRGIAVWHRRSGKDKTLINAMAKETAKRVGTYNYLYPTYAQAKKALWDGMDKNGFPYMGHFPSEYLRSKNEQEMRIELVNGSAFQLIGSDKIDSMMSTNPIGAVLSEFSLQTPGAWSFLTPIFNENEGFAFFAFTPRGRNHAHQLYKHALKHADEWFVQTLTVEDTGMEHLVDEARKDGMEDEMIEQEYYCSFNAPQMGSYYGKQMTAARTAKRIGRVPHDETLQVHTFWDLGISDYMSIWFVQFAGQEVHLIDYYENCNEGMPHYVRMLEERRDAQKYLYGEHWGPHDIEVRELSTGVSRRRTAEDLGISFRVVPQSDLMDGIEAVRKLIPRCWFDEENAERGIGCLENYRKQWNEKLQVYASQPLHDEYSHGADAFRTLANAIPLGAGQSTSGMSAEKARSLARVRFRG